MYSLEDVEINDVPRVGVRLDAYPHTLFVVGAVEFLEVEDSLRVKYNYDIVSGITPTDTRQFEHAVGDFIVHYFQNQKEHPVAYHGGIDEY